MNGDGGGVNERARVIRSSSGGIGIVAAGALRPFCLCHASMFRSCNLASSPASPPLRAPRSRHAARPPTHPPPASCAMAFARPHPALDFWSRAAHGDSSTTTSSRSEVSRLRYACRGGGEGGGSGARQRTAVRELAGVWRQGSGRRAASAVAAFSRAAVQHAPSPGLLCESRWRRSRRCPEAGELRPALSSSERGGRLQLGQGSPGREEVG